jgi:serine/threonine protein kinase
METLQLSEGSSKSNSSETYASIGFSPRFSIQGRLAEGGTSTLYVARDTLLGSSLVVLKKINDSLLRSKATRDIALREVSIAKQVSHPNLVRIFDIRRSKKSEYLVMEYLRGSSLKDLLARSRFSYSSALSIIRPLASVLSYLHEKGVIHSDVKPSNVVVTGAGEVKLIDLANCRTDSESSSPSVVIKGDHYFGYSLDYSSPQVIADKPATKGDDVFSLSCVLYELLEGCSPIPSEKQSVDMSLSSVKKPKSINFWQWAVLKKGMAADNEKRYKSVDQFYKRFTRAKYIPNGILFGLFATLLAGFVAFKVMPTMNEFQGEQTIHGEVYEQQQSVQAAISSILSQKPMERYQSLKQLESFPPLLRDGALSELYPDVVLPIVGYIKNELLIQNDVPDFDLLHSYLDEILVFYPRSSDLASLKASLESEQKMYINSIAVQLSSIADGGLYDASQGGELNRLVGQLADLGVSVKGGFIGAGYGDTYNGYVSRAMESKDWVSLSDAYDFASIVGRYLPEFSQAWLNVDEQSIKHARLLATYVRGGQYNLDRFPEESFSYLLTGELKALKASIGKAWYNKDITNRAEELLLLKAQYQIPSESSLYAQLRDSLNNKIDQKIRFHKSKNQTISARNLADLSKKLNK